MSGSALQAGVCQLCPLNCATCSGENESLCFNCISGFTLIINGNTTSCSPCGLGCSTCDIINSSVCLYCLPGTYLNKDTATCVKCKQGCE